MISVCIPIYQYDVYELIKEIYNQCIASSINFEIICIDDNSDSFYKTKNKRIEEFDYTSYIELNENIGRSKIRNLFLKKSNFSSLLFLDCDCSIPNKNFIIKYSENINKDIVYGGRKHHKKKPLDEKIVLRWEYGKNREDLSYNERINSPYLSFRSNNFLVKKKTLELYRFDESISTYGHEDTLFAFQLEKEKINIHHIDNHVIHEGLETNIDFLNKTKSAVKNLFILYLSGKIESEKIKLLKTYRFLKKIKLTFFMRAFSSFIIKICTKKLLHKNPKIFWLDIYKLFYLIKIKHDV
ncbi:MAG: glycosyl transferase [Crocinitomicaceae bacterium]|nr:glycosyl transferase [Crocinitomicaceae bacterium]